MKRSENLEKDVIINPTTNQLRRSTRKKKQIKKFNKEGEKAKD